MKIIKITRYFDIIHELMSFLSWEIEIYQEIHIIRKTLTFYFWREKETLKKFTPHLGVGWVLSLEWKINKNNQKSYK